MNYAMVNKQGITFVHVTADEFGVDNGEMIGAINAAVSTKKKEMLIEIISSSEGIAPVIPLTVKNKNVSITMLMIDTFFLHVKKV
ncbi:hypothetical protein [Bacillus vallismortis]|uniref:hypothetical protein n=1 Tax=Bacillus vallismortis TaxID=72361 RepID=UPI003B97DD02